MFSCSITSIGFSSVYLRECKRAEKWNGFQNAVKYSHLFLASQLLAMLLKKKRSLLNSHILHLTFSLVGTVDSGHETAIIPNSTAFQDLLCDFEVEA